MKYTKEDENHEKAKDFIEATKRMFWGNKKSEEYLKGWEDGVMDFAHALDGNFS